MALSSNLQWRDIGVNFGDSNSLAANAGRTLSQAGDIFSNMYKSVMENEQKKFEQDYKNRQLEQALQIHQDDMEYKNASLDEQRAYHKEQLANERKKLRIDQENKKLLIDWKNREDRNKKEFTEAVKQINADQKAEINNAPTEVKNLENQASTITKPFDDVVNRYNQLGKTITDYTRQAENIKTQLRKSNPFDYLNQYGIVLDKDVKKGLKSVISINGQDVSREEAEEALNTLNDNILEFKKEYFDLYAKQNSNEFKTQYADAKKQSDDLRTRAEQIARRAGALQNSSVYQQNDVYNKLLNRGIDPDQMGFNLPKMLTENEMNIITGEYGNKLGYDPKTGKPFMTDKGSKANKITDKDSFMKLLSQAKSLNGEPLFKNVSPGDAEDLWEIVNKYKDKVPTDLLISYIASGKDDTSNWIKWFPGVHSRTFDTSKIENMLKVFNTGGD